MPGKEAGEKTYREGMSADAPDREAVIPGVDSPCQHLMQVHSEASLRHTGQARSGQLRHPEPLGRCYSRKRR